MQIDAILSRWLDILASLAVKLQLAWQSRRTAIVTREDESFVVRRSGATGDIIAHVGVGKPISPTAAAALRNHFLIFELAPENVVIRHLKVPLQAREFAGGIVGNQIERLSPWPTAQTIYGFEAHESADDAAALDLAVFVTTRAKIEAAGNTLASSGLIANEISVKSGSDSRVALWTQAASSPQMAQNLPRLIGGGLAAMALISAAISLWGYYSANALQAESDDLSARTDALRQEEALSRRPRNLAALSPAGRAWALKEDSPAMVTVFDALTRAIPDGAYLTQLRTEKADLHIVGRAADPPSLIAALTKSKDFSEVRFFAPTVRSVDGGLYEFSIAAHILPREDTEP